MPRLAVLFVLSAASSPCPDLNLIHYIKTANLSMRFPLADCQAGKPFPVPIPNPMPSEPSDGIGCLFVHPDGGRFVLCRLVPVIQHSEFDGDASL
ncbi:hypothetical protein JY21_02985 [Neisseria meningitidis]|nr:hypothetical protein JY21_02985 [Neisseria meningitidis]